MKKYSRNYAIETHKTGVIGPITKIVIIAIFIVAAIIGGTYGQTTTRYGAQAEVFAQTPFSSGSSVGVFGNVLYQYDGEKFSQNAAHQLEGVGGLSVALGGDAIIALGGGYKQNFTYQEDNQLLILGYMYNQ